LLFVWLVLPELLLDPALLLLFIELDTLLPD